MSINLSCGLLEVRLSRQVLDLADRIYHSLTNLITSLVNRIIRYYSANYLLKGSFVKTAAVE